jgi:succinoglycan biosynthesis protein ExoA
VPTLRRAVGGSIRQPDSPPVCSVIVPVLNELRTIADAVDSMLGQKGIGAIEVLLIDGGSTDGTRELLASLAERDPRIRLLENPSGATPTALNIGLREATGTWIARMDAHSEYPDRYLARAIERLSAGDTSWVSGPMIARGTNAVSRAVALAMSNRVGRGGTRRWQTDAVAQATEYKLDSGVFCGVWPRTELCRFGGWDERWLRNQDSEMAGRFLAAGEQLVCVPAMAATYVPRRTLRALWRQYVQYGEFRLRTGVRHPDTLRPSHLLAPAVVGAMVSAACGPSVPRRIARIAVGSWGAFLVSAAVQALGRAESPGDALLVPSVMATMHLGHGVGFWRGVFKYGPPVCAVARIAGLKRLAARFRPPPSPVYAPELERQI